jgi:type IX secretion system PorP/SprF family membrane protein
MMMKNLRSIAILVCAFLVQAGYAQDIHFSQFNYAPLALNPALAGMGTCDYRVILNARTQWNTVSTGGNTYTTTNASADFALARLTKYNSYLGLGFSVSSDLAGTDNMMQTRFDISLAYHFVMDRRANSSISAGLQFGTNYWGFDPSKATFDQQYNAVAGQYDPHLPGEKFNRSSMIFLDAGAGVVYSQYFKQKRNNFYFGVSFNHVNQPNISWESAGLYNSSGAQQLFVKTSVHGGGSFFVGNGTWIMPTYLLLFQGPSQQYNFGSLVKFRIGNNISTTFFYAGAQFRFPYDAFILQTRIDYKHVMFGFSYDINVSKLVPASQTVGAPELVFMYQGCMSKKSRKLKGFPCPVM